MAAEPSSTLLPFNTLIHMVTIKLSSSNYLLWKSQLLPLLESQELIGHVDGTLEPPPRFAPANFQTPNIKHLAWKQTDQRLLSLLLSSLTEEAMAKVVGLTTSREVWIALENTFSHRSKAREIRLKDDLQLMKRGTRTVSEYACAFKAICDQLHAIGQAVDGTDKPAVLSVAAFVASNRNSQKPNQRNHSSRNPQGRTGGHGKGQGCFSGKRPPRCQICRVKGHYADRCRQRYDHHGHAPEAQLAEALTSSYSISGNEASDWYLDTGASAHMTSAHSNLDQSTSYTGKDCVIVGNGASLPITHTGTISPSPDLKLQLLLMQVHLCRTRPPARLLLSSSLSYLSLFALLFPLLRQAPIPMLTRAKADIFKTRHPAHLGLVESSGLLSALLASTEPKGFKSAAKNPEWLAAMDEEIQTLQSNRTWILVPRPANTNIMGSKWVFRTKYLPNGSIERLKARLVAKGYTQVPGLDHTDTFSPIIYATTVCVVLSLAVTNKWPLRQLDVKNVFLNGHLTEHVYMEQPPGYIDPRFPNHICQLKKALYGLKQAPRAWFQRFSSFLLQLGFYCSRADTSLFVFHKHSNIIYLLLYVDDIIITGNNPSLLENFTCKLNSEFATKDLGSLSYFLGLEATPTTDGLFIRCPDTRCPTSGYSIYLGDNLVSWNAKKHPTVSRSSFSHSQPPLLLCDNKSAIFLSSNPVSHKRAKHVELDYHFLRELVLAGKLRTQYVPSHLQVADIFTKSVSQPLFEFFRSKLHVRSNPTLSLRGSVEDHVKDPLP
uniref:Reverse transcriptase Ty1/copia-type domain-containing protein n=1 Tax=Fagus sylvatica TaxID=28930 RepID=A0A2N9JAS4_FAGSY